MRLTPILESRVLIFQKSDVLGFYRGLSPLIAVSIPLKAVR
jgi:hypothetical protein